MALEYMSEFLHARKSCPASLVRDQYPMATRTTLQPENRVDIS